MKLIDLINKLRDKALLDSMEYTNYPEYRIGTYSKLEIDGDNVCMIKFLPKDKVRLYFDNTHTKLEDYSLNTVVNYNLYTKSHI